MRNNDITIRPVPGSLAAQSEASSKPLAETFINADVIVIVDTSGSMSLTDETETTRYRRACKELEKVQATMPGKICVISFSGECMFCPSGIPWDYGCGTDLAKALKFAKIADVPDMRFIVISDGEPDDETAALNIARSYKNHIDTIYIGSKRDNGGQLFLEKLAKASGGIAANDFSAHQLSNTVYGLLA